MLERKKGRQDSVMSSKWTDEWREALTASNAVDCPSKMNATGFSNVEVNDDVNRSSFGGVIEMKA